jgi:hypothetical protein
MTETAPVVLVRARRPAPARSGRGLRFLPWLALVCALGLAGEASAAPVTVGLGIGADVPGVPIASELTIDRGDPLGIALSVPVLVGHLRVEPQLAYSGIAHAYGVPPAGKQGPCPGLMKCTAEAVEGGRAMASLAIGPAWSVGEKGRMWAGPWGGLIFRASTVGQRDWSLGASVGGEFFLADGFSFGLDVRAAFTSVESGIERTDTTYTVTPHESETVVESGWTVGVDGLAAFRFYLN